MLDAVDLMGRLPIMERSGTYSWVAREGAEEMVPVAKKTEQDPAATMMRETLREVLREQRDQIAQLVREEIREQLSSNSSAPISERRETLAPPSLTHEDVNPIGSRWWIIVWTGGRHAVPAERVGGYVVDHDFNIQEYRMRNLENVDERGRPPYRALSEIFRTKEEAERSPRTSTPSREIPSIEGSKRASIRKAKA